MDKRTAAAKPLDTILLRELVTLALTSPAFTPTILDADMAETFDGIMRTLHVGTRAWRGSQAVRQ